MDQQQDQNPHQQHIPHDHNPGNYTFYQPEQEPYGLAYNSQMGPYAVAQQQQQQHPGPPPRQLSQPDMQQQGMPFHNLSLMSPHQYQPPVYGSPQHVSMPLAGSPPPPPSPTMYDPLSPPISGSDTSGEGVYHHSRNSSANGSPSSSRGNSLVHRTQLRYNPTPSPTSSSGRRGRGRSLNDSDDDDMGAHFVENLAHTRKEATRRQRIEAEQRRRDELRDGYARLKEVLPISNQKSSKVSLLERATNHIVAVEKANKEMQDRLDFLEAEVQRLQKLNEKISLGAGNTPSPGHPGVPNDNRPISPPPESAMPSHSLASVRGQEPPREDSSPSASESGY